METEGKTNAPHEQARQNARGNEIPADTLSGMGETGTAEGLTATAKMLETWAPECFPENEQGQVHFARALMEAAAAEIRAYLANSPAQAEVPMEDERPLDTNVERLVADYPPHGTVLALAQSLKAMGEARAADGAEGHAVICRRAARFVRIMAMQVTRFLAQPDLRLSHPTLDADLQVTATDVTDSGTVHVHCNVLEQADMPATFPLHELVAAGPVSDISRIMVQIMARAVTQDALGQLMKDGRMPGLDELTARHGLDMDTFSGVSVGFEPPPGDEAFNGEQLAEEPQSGTVHNLTAHAGYVMKDGQCVPDDLPLEGQ